MERRERTRQLIELGGLVAKAGLVELTGDDRAMILGALLGLADAASGPEHANTRELWRRRGRRAFERDQAEAGAQIFGATKTRAEGAALNFDALRRREP